MASYNYMCGCCKYSDLDDWGEKDPKEVLRNLFGKKVCVYAENEDWDSSRLVWEEWHSFSENPEIICPNCDSKASRTLLGVKVSFYIRGDGMAKDKQGARRDMHLHKLVNDDPYAYMRESGEADDLAQRLRRAGKHGYDGNGRPKTQYFTA